MVRLGDKTEIYMIGKKTEEEATNRNRASGGKMTIPQKTAQAKNNLLSTRQSGKQKGSTCIIL